MEKRTIIAFVLSFLVLIFWSTLFQPPPRTSREGEEKAKTDLKTAAAPSRENSSLGQSDNTKALQGEGDRLIAPLAENAEAKKVIVDTPLYRAEFSTAGPTITSFKLKRYRQSTAKGSPPVELVHLKNSSGGLVEMAFQPITARNPQRIIYQTDQESIILKEGSSPQDLIFRAVTAEGLILTQTFRIHPDKYPIDLNLVFKNSTNRSLDGKVSGSIQNLPPEKSGGYSSFSGLALLLDEKLKEVPPKKMKDEKSFSGRIDWMAYEDHHFMTALIPEIREKAQARGRLTPSGAVVGTYASSPFSIPPGGVFTARFTLYLGPRDLTILKSLGKDLDRAINFGWFDWIAKPLLYTLRFFYKYVGNYGVAIIILTVLIKILFWPLTHKSYKSMKEMQKLQPHMARLREKYKNNKEQLNKELMSLYKTYKVNPLGGCLPMLIQIPVFFALFRILGNAIELRHAPFVLWINDLSAPDRLFHFPFKIPLMAPPYGIPVLTLLMGASMLIQQKMTPTPGDPAQAKLMMFLPLVFTVMFINFPSGLVLYWLTNNILSIGQQYRIMKSSS
ncbi:MAG: membrane protein insertase YidC [Deltaproteobacteria bacterium]|nr:membrane protein insertase YidC [Deltaproteobacteria bacterium]MBW2017056.1 membrane protein insertase YidC [Deltaproteobacteria bacterium]MBW2127780.1 membrane protein insertase YidC [Deltaproteobacteria bacterium]MBW2304390.1 membrane protein insertase YidC [Deltaproteobacteria bacterium]